MTHKTYDAELKQGCEKLQILKVILNVNKYTTEFTLRNYLIPSLVKKNTLANI